MKDEGVLMSHFSLVSVEGCHGVHGLCYVLCAMRYALCAMPCVLTHDLGCFAAGTGFFLVLDRG